MAFTCSFSTTKNYGMTDLHKKVHGIEKENQNTAAVVNIQMYLYIYIIGKR